MLQITGLDGTKQPDQRHLEKEYPGEQPLVYVVGTMKELEDLKITVYGTPSAKVVTWDVVPRSFFFQGDWQRQKSSPDNRGQLDLSGAVNNSDAFCFDRPMTIVDGDKKRSVAVRCFVLSPIYPWPCQYLAELPPDALKKCQEEGMYRFFPTSPPRTAVAISGLQVGELCDAVLGGERGDIMVRVGMAVKFKAELGVEALDKMTGVVTGISESGIMVQVVIEKGQWPPPGNTFNMDPPTSAQTNLALNVRPEDVIAEAVCTPTVIWPFPEKTTHLHVAGHMDFQVKDEIQGTVSTLDVIRGAYDEGPLAGLVHLNVHRLGPLNPLLAFKIVARGLPEIHGSSAHCLEALLDFIQQRVGEFARGKAAMTNTPHADNTLHLRVDGALFLRVLDKYLKMDECDVSVMDGVFFVTARSWEAAQLLLLPPGQADGVFDLRSYGWGLVELFAPIVFKWEIYDTTRGRDNARSPDGFVAITFSGYEERGRHNLPGGIKDTRPHPQTSRQMYKRPSACPGF